MDLFRVLLVLLLLFSGCSRRNISEDAAPVLSGPDLWETAAGGNVNGGEDLATAELASAMADALDDRRLAAQVIISGIDGRGRLPPHMRELLEECPPGGIMLFRYNLDSENDAIQSLISETSQLVSSGGTDEEKTAAAIPPFVSVDHEGGLVNRFQPGVADLPPALFYREMAQSKGRESAIVQINSDSFNAGKILSGLGINLNFAPVSETLNGNNGDFLEERSYGPDADFTARAAAAFIMGMERAGVLCVAKHFPGSAGTDPHLFPSVLLGDKAALAELTAPFAALIQDGHARAVMVSHSSVPAWDSEKIASLSPAVMGGWLRQELGFAGLVICDDFSMSAAGSGQENGGGAAGPETAAVQSLAAGADMVLVWPPDLRRTHRAIQAALGDGRLSRERLRDAARRILYEKIKMGLIKEEQAGGNGQ